MLGAATDTADVVVPVGQAFDPSVLQPRYAAAVDKMQDHIRDAQAQLEALRCGTAPTPSVGAEVVQWLAGGERGASSDTIVAHLTGLSVPRQGVPRDYWDLRRCLLLLEQCPSLGTRFDDMAEAGVEWASLVAKWDALKTCVAEDPDWRSGTHYNYSASLLLRKILETARKPSCP